MSDTATRTSLIAAAASAVGPKQAFTKTIIRKRNDEEVQVEVIDEAAWAAEVTQTATTLLDLVGEKGQFAMVLDAIEGAADKTNEKYKAFTGVVEKVKREQSTTRGVVYLSGTGTQHLGKDPFTDEDLPMGWEVVRTDRTDNSAGFAMAKRIQDTLVGHKVLLYIEIETYNRGAGTKKSRVLRHIVDLGTDHPSN